MSKKKDVNIQSYLPGGTGDFLTDAPDKINFVQQPAFKFILNRTPKLSFMCQRVNLPGIGVEELTFATQRGFQGIPIAGAAQLDDFEISFAVEEDLTNWREIYDWIHSITTVKDTKSYETINNHYSQAELIILNSAMKPNYRVSFENIFPKTLSGIEFDATVGTIETTQATATFAYTSYEVEKLETP